MARIRPNQPGSGWINRGTGVGGRAAVSAVRLMHNLLRMTLGPMSQMLMRGQFMGAAVMGCVTLVILSLVLAALGAVVHLVFSVALIVSAAALGFTGGRRLLDAVRGTARWIVAGACVVAAIGLFAVAAAPRSSVSGTFVLAIAVGLLGMAAASFTGVATLPELSSLPGFGPPNTLPNIHKLPKAVHTDPITKRKIPELPGVVFLGRSTPDPRSGGYLMSGEKMAVLLVGQSQSGKTSGVFIPTILSWPGSLIATSTKSDILRDTLDARRYWARQRGGNVYVYDPMGSSPHLVSVRWAPHEGCADQANCQRRVSALVNALPSANDPKNDYFVQGAQRLLRALFNAAALEGLEFPQILRWLRSQRLAAQAVVILNAHRANNYAQDLESLLRDEAPTTLGNVFNTALSVFSSVGAQVVEDNTKVSDLDPDKFLTTGSTLYILPPASDQQAVGPMVAGFIQSIVDHAYRLARQQRSGRLDPRLLLALDELANIAPLPELPTIMSQGISQGVLTLIGLQAVSQLRARYTKDKAEIVLDSSHVRMFWGNVSSSEATELSTLIGNVQIDMKSQHQPGFGGPLFGSQTVGKQFVPLMPADAIRQMPPGEAVCMYVGKEVCKVWTPPVAQPSDPIFGEAFGASTLRNDPLRRRP